MSISAGKEPRTLELNQFFITCFRPSHKVSFQSHLSLEKIVGLPFTKKHMRYRRKENVRFSLGEKWVLSSVNSRCIYFFSQCTKCFRFLPRTPHWQKIASFHYPPFPSDFYDHHFEPSLRLSSSPWVNLHDTFSNLSADKAYFFQAEKEGVHKITHDFHSHFFFFWNFERETRGKKSQAEFR